jgi:aromatase
MNKGGKCRMGSTKNSIVILRDFDTVFDLTNTIELWPQLFTEYEKAEILERHGNEIVFRLTTFPEGEVPAHSWVSRRRIEKETKQAIAERLDPTFPFQYMHIHWTYEDLPDRSGVVMTWTQEFAPHPEFPKTVEEMEAYLNHHTRIQMQAIKTKIEQGLVSKGEKY